MKLPLLTISLCCLAATAAAQNPNLAPGWNPTADKYKGGSGNQVNADLAKGGVQATRSAKPAAEAVPGKSLTNASNTGGLRNDLVQGILNAEKQQGAKESKLVDTKITAAPKAGTADDLSTASWTEEWSVQRAGGKKATYVIAFNGQGKGKSISYKVSMKP